MRTDHLLFFISANIHLQIVFVASYELVLHPEHSLLSPLPNEFDLWKLGPLASYANRSLKLLDFGYWVAEYAWNGIPVNYCNWVVTIAYTIETMRIRHRGRRMRLPDLYGDGFGLFYTREPIKHAVTDTDHNCLGGPNNFYGLAILVDTWTNYFWDSGFPRAYPVLLHDDKVYNHYKNGWYQRPYSCPYQEVDRLNFIRAEYLNEKFKLQTFDSSGRMNCERHTDWMILPPGYYFSFTAFNGGVSERVLIHEFKVEEIADGNECYDREKQTPWWNHG